jgi:inward rectifier potassium channel
LNLPVERNKINILTLSWTVVHPLNEDSPIYGFTKEDLNKSDAEFLVFLKAFDDTFSQTVHSRTSYQNEEVVWKGMFKPVYSPNKEGIFEIDMSKVSDYEKL